jgi:hypothetical protein
MNTLICPIAVVLTDIELYYARSVGRERHESSLAFGFRDKHGCPGGEDISLLGACGELAYCKAVGAEWSASIFSFKGADHGLNIQIRTSPCKKQIPPADFGNLIIRDDDNDDHYFVLVVGNPPHFLIKGWIAGRDAKVDKWKNNHAGRPPAWFVPHRHLHLDLSTLVGEGLEA